MKAWVIRNRATGLYFVGRWDDGTLLEAYWCQFTPSIDIFSGPQQDDLLVKIIEQEMADATRYCPAPRVRDLQVVEIEVIPPKEKLPIIVAGIGSRATPADVCAQMEAVGGWCWDNGIVLRSGHAEGADLAFERGVDGALAEIWLPWKSYNRESRMPASTYCVTELDADLQKIVEANHPAPANLSRGALLMMARNANIILGANLRTPVTAVVCWTPDEEHGGTSFGIRLARRHGIPVINMAKTHNLSAAAVCAELEQLRADL